MTKRLHRSALLVSVSVLIAGMFVSALGNDSAASVALGGIQLRREANISMEKEVLTISEAKVVVEYEFLNETDKDITTQVAFPIPPYSEGFPVRTDDVSDFRLWVEGKRLKYQANAAAEVENKNYTDLLTKLGVDLATFGHWDTDNQGNPTGQIAKLPKEQFQELAKVGLIRSDDGFPLWDVVKTYHWTQTFPAHKILHVRHEYTPSFGFAEMKPSELDPEARKQRIDELRRRSHYPTETIDGTSLLALGKLYKNIDHSCIDPSLRKSLMADAAKKYKPEEDVLAMAWVDYILTTANSWKTPIRDFTLIIDRLPGPQFAQARQYVSLCWDGAIKRTDDYHFVAHETNFIPKKELHVAFLSVLGGGN